MKRYILNILLFFCIVSVIDLSFGTAGDYLQAHAKGGETKRTDDIIKREKHDILILGSSRAHHHYDAPFLCDTLGLDVYNAGFDGNGVVLAVGLLELAMERYRPQLILYDVEPSFDIYIYGPDNNNTRYIEFIKPYYRDRAIGNIIKDVSSEEWYKVHSGLLRYNSNTIQLLVENLIARKIDNHGFSPLEGEYKGIKKNSEKKKVIIDDFKLKYIQKLIDLAKANSVPIAFVASPKYGEENSEIFAPVKSKCKENGIPFFDYYADEVFMKHPDWFKEPMHLNTKGSRIFSEMILDDLLKLL